MCEIWDYSIEHKDIYPDKYSQSSAPMMDLYITDSLQEMLDMDIKSEMATDLNSITDFSDTFGLNFSDLPPLLEMDTDNSATWLNTSSFVHNLDLYGSEANAVMVNPNSVMPSSFAETPMKKIVKEEASDLMLTSTASSEESRGTTLPSPKEEKSHLTFSPNPVKVPKVKQEPEEPTPSPTAAAPAVKKTLEEATQMVIYVRKQDSNVVKDLLNDLENKKMHVNTQKVVSVQSPAPAVRIKTAPGEIIKVNNNKKCSIVSSGQKITQQLGSKTIISGNIHILDAQQSRTILANSAHNKATILFDNSLSGRKLIKSGENGSFSLVGAAQAKFVSAAAALGDFPKPAYSYSCLIAMALKNSRTGSLPVSEIYNFMCQHFPYFKTAPNGWKNSVRHNLSLNKCFEKIEKPSTTGSQRKGCLWAMNPAKVGKMDEEVQKWSRKDPMAIKKAMVYPENLEALERGEMKYSGAGADAEHDDADDNDADIDPDADLDAEAKEEDDTAIEQEVSDQEPDDIEEADSMETEEVEVEEVVGGTGLVGGTYRLLATGPSAYLADTDDDDVSDVEVLDHSYEEINVDLRNPVKLDLSLNDDYNYSVPAKRSKTTFIYQPAQHASRRKTPLVNRVALM